MKYQSTLALAIGTALFAQAPAYAIEITDYTEPTITSEEAYITGFFNSSSGGDGKDTWNANLIIDYNRLFDSRDRRLEYGVLGSYADSKESDSLYSALGFVDFRSYIQSRPNIYWFGDAAANTGNDITDTASLTAGMGYGRVVDATPLAQALRVVEELQEHKIVTGNVSDKGYLALAQILAKQSEYLSKFGGEEYMPEFVAAVEKVMLDNGIVSDHLSAIATAYLQQVLDGYDKVQKRRYGWRVQGGLGAQIYDNDIDTASDPLIQIKFEYAKPIGLQGQFLNTATYGATWQDGDTVGQNIENVMEYIYEISDKVDWENAWTMKLLFSDDDSRDVISNKLTSSLSYYLTNRLKLKATLGLSHEDDDLGDDDPVFTTNLAVEYRLR